jgi:hypothetical protein
MGKVLGKKILRKELTEKICFHFKEIFEGEWEEKTLEEILKF